MNSRRPRQTRLRPSQGGKMHGPVIGGMEKPDGVMVYGGPGGDKSCDGCGYHVCSCVHDPIADLEAAIDVMRDANPLPQPIATNGCNAYLFMRVHDTMSAGHVDVHPAAPRPFKVGDRVEWTSLGDRASGEVAQSLPDKCAAQIMWDDGVLCWHDDVPSKYLRHADK